MLLTSLAIKTLLSKMVEIKIQDQLNLRIVEEMLKRPGATFKQIGAQIGSDQRTIARRIRELEQTGVLRHSLEIDWKSLGMEVTAFVGLTTARNPKASVLLPDYLKNDPRIVEAYETVGSNQFFIKVLERDIFSVRETVLRDLDPLAGDMTTSLLAKVIKPRDYFSLVRHVREGKYPTSRSLS